MLLQQKSYTVRRVADALEIAEGALESTRDILESIHGFVESIHNVPESAYDVFKSVQDDIESKIHSELNWIMTVEYIRLHQKQNKIEIH